MNAKHTSTNAAERRVALSSPLRMELVGLYTDAAPLSIADMARRTGRPATSLYHHVHVLERAGILENAGTRPKGKRFETLYRLADKRLELDPDDADPRSAEQLLRALSAAFRMTERDFSAAMETGQAVPEGDQRNIVGLRIHMRTGPEGLAELNRRLDSILDWLVANAETDEPAGADDQFISLTLALAPLRGRRTGTDQEPGATA